MIISVFIVFEKYCQPKNKTNLAAKPKETWAKLKKFL
jgi:hypothetical protein